MRFGFKRACVLLLTAVLLLSLLPGCSTSEEHTAYYFDYFDTFSYFTAYTAHSDDFARYDSLVREELEYYHIMLNGFSAKDPDSDSAPAELTASTLSQLNALAGQESIKVSKDLFSFLKFGKEAWELSHHTVNIAMGSVTRLWKEQQEAEFPSVPLNEDLQQAFSYAEIENLLLDEERLSISLPAGMILDVGAIAKGYVAGKVRDKLLEEGCEIFLLSLGGNILSQGKPPRKNGWMVGIANPRYEEGSSESNLLESVTLKDASLVTSGDYERFFMVDGVRYHHIIDPQTLFPGTRYCSVTVCCTNAALADLLSTTLFLLPMEEGEELTASLCGKDWSLVYVDPAGTITHFRG